ncbi:MAG: GDP-L-fucose synthase [Nitrospirae bacterium]|nr:GDP-L-fucose synthase [Candidatus Manganitrophaceae bacterium]
MIRGGLQSIGRTLQIWEAKRIYIAGHQGLIGSALVRRLEAKGQPILTRTRDELDLCNRTQVDAFFNKEKPDTVFLAAGRVGGIIENREYPADFITENLELQLNVLRASHQAGVKRLIFFGSSCMYPRECPQPMKESQLLSGRPEPTSLAYAISKLAGLEMCLSYNRQYGEQRFLPVIPNSAYGPHDNFSPASSHVLSALIRKMHEAKVKEEKSVVLWGTGDPRREFIHADDIAAACLLLLEQDVSKVEFPLNIGVGSDQSIRELAEIIRRVVGYEGKIEWDTSKPDGAPRKLLDSTRFIALGWRSRITLEEGLRNTYEWFIKQEGSV